MEYLSFNPRARVGRDKSFVIHFHPPYGFNPRARVGRDLLQFFLTLRGVKFQSTRPRGARRYILIPYQNPL